MSDPVKVALVTGGLTGIGATISKFLTQDGYLVYSGSRSGTSKMNIYMDVRDEDSVRCAFDNIINENGRFDVLVNNAGIASQTPIEQCELSEWEAIISTNLTGAFLCSREAIRHFLQYGSGNIVNISSIAGKHYSLTANEAYTCSKYGMIGLTRQLAYRYGNRGIRVNAVCPSQTLTEMLERGTSEEQRNKLSRRNPMERLAEQDEVAEVVRFLISKKCEFMNGACVDVNGGIL